MRPVASAGRRPWRWPLGWLFMLGVVLGLGLWGWCAWLWFHGADIGHNARYDWVFSTLWLTPALWLAMFALGLLGLVLTVNNLIRRDWKRAMWWLLIAGLGTGNCVASFLPLAVFMGAGTTTEVPKE